jgi:DNA polymerase III alpha subunit
MLLELECLARRRELSGGVAMLWDDDTDIHRDEEDERDQGDGWNDDSCGAAVVGADANVRERARICRREAEILGFMVGGHPMDFVHVPGRVVAARDIRRHAGRRVRMVGWAIAWKVLATKNGRGLMKMLTLEDRTDVFEAVLFPRVYARYAPRTLTGGPYLVEGRVDISLGSPTLNIDRLELLR